MIYGRFRDGFSRIALDRPLASGGTRSIEFIVDPGFEGDLTLEPRLLASLDARYAGEYPFALADLTYRTRPVYEAEVEWMGESRVVAIVAMDGNSLMGVGVLRGNLVQMEMDDAGEVAIGPL